MGQIRSWVLAGPNHPDALLDALLAFAPQLFTECPSLNSVIAQVCELTMLDFDLDAKQIPAQWPALREEARPIFNQLPIYVADIKRLDKAS